MKRLLIAGAALMLASPAWAAPIVESGQFANDSSIAWFHATIGPQNPDLATVDLGSEFFEAAYWFGSPTDPQGMTQFGGSIWAGSGLTTLDAYAPNTDFIFAVSWANNDLMDQGDTGGFYPLVSFNPLNTFAYGGDPIGSVTLSHWTCSNHRFCFGVDNGTGQYNVSFDGFTSVEALNNPSGPSDPPAGVLEPNAASLLGMGLLGLGGLGWRRKSKK